MGKSEIVGYEPLLNDLKEMIQNKQYRVLKLLNSETINLYWEIGKEIKNISTPIGVATYQLRNTLPEEMKAMLPEPEEIVKKLRLFDNKL